MFHSQTSMHSLILERFYPHPKRTKTSKLLLRWHLRKNTGVCIHTERYGFWLQFGWKLAGCHLKEKCRFENFRRAFKFDRPMHDSIRKPAATADTVKTLNRKLRASLQKHLGQVLCSNFVNQPIFWCSRANTHQHIICCNHFIFLAKVCGDGKVCFPCSVLIRWLESQPTGPFVQAYLYSFVKQNDSNEVGFWKQ